MIEMLKFMPIKCCRHPGFAFLGLLIMPVMQSFFTGIESTPEITYKEVRKQNAVASREQEMAESFTPEKYAGWKPGKRFFVTDPKVAWALRGAAGIQRGDTLEILCFSEGIDITGAPTREIAMRNLRMPSDTIVCVAPEVGKTEYYRIPFLIEESVIDTMRRALVGNTYYLKSALWYSDDGNTVRGRKFIPVKITGVMPFSDDYAAMVSIVDESNGATSGVLMSQNVGSPTRSFDTLFSITDPRRNYPETTDANWEAIRNSRVNDGMTRREVTAALGVPASIDRGVNQSAAYERWTYSDGISLLFVDGILTKR